MTADRAARARALDPGACFIVQAPAGSGKTEVLTQRFLRLLARVERPERVLAITFTRKATQQMRSRISTRLFQARDGVCPEESHERQAVDLASEVLEQDRQRGWKLLECPGRLRINTIDGLCTQLLARDPVLGPRWCDARVLEYPDPLYRESIRRVFQGIDDFVSGGDRVAEAAQDALVSLLDYLGGNAQRLQELLVVMLGQRSLWRRHLETGHEALDRLLEDRQRLALDSFCRALGDESLMEAAGLAESLGVDVGSFDGSQRSRLHCAYRVADLLTTTANKPRAPSRINRGLFPGMDPAREPELERLKEIYAEWHASEDSQDALHRMADWPPLDDLHEDGFERRTLLDSARAVLSLALIELDTLMAERGQADFTAIAEAALQSLGTDTEPADLLLAEDARIDHILMDEFQDTSFAQFQLLHRLTAGWEPDDGRTLFLVGDPMQSIYRFREADVGFFNDVVQLGRLGQVRVEPLWLTSNFRSNSELIEWFNTTFSTVFPSYDASDSGAVSYSPVSSELPGGGKVNLHALDARNPHESQDACIAEAISAARREMADPGIAILVRTRRQVPAIAAGLRRFEIEFESVDIGSLAGRGVVQDLLALTRSLVHPMDRIAWIALLRAPWCGLRIGQIHQVVGQDPGIPVLDSMAEAVDAALLPPDAHDRLRRVWRVMRHARRFAASNSLAWLVEKCWIQLGGPLCCADEADIENAEAFLEVLEETCLEGSQEVVERLEEALEYRYAASRSARVQIMTIHKAKGLEFDVVILPDLEKTGGGGRESLIALQEFAFEDNRGVLMAPLTPRSRAPVSLYRYLNKVDAERAGYESQRVLYVACTRARAALHLIATIGRTTRGAPSFPASSFLKLLESTFRPLAERMPEVPDGEPRVAQAEVDANSPQPLLRLAGSLPEPQLGVLEENQETCELPGLPDREAVALGTVLHRWLELIHDHPQPAWDARRIERSGASIRSSLLRAGAPEDSLDRLQDRCVRILIDFIDGGELAATMIPGQPLHSWSEFPLYRRDGAGFSQHLIDLLVQDSEGAMHIIDYKTSGSPDGGAMRAAWQEQLDRYRELIEKFISAPIAAPRIRVLDPGGGAGSED